MRTLLLGVVFSLWTYERAPIYLGDTVTMKSIGLDAFDFTQPVPHINTIMSCTHNGKTVDCNDLIVPGEGLRISDNGGYE